MKQVLILLFVASASVVQTAGLDFEWIRQEGGVGYPWDSPSGVARDAVLSKLGNPADR